MTLFDPNPDQHLVVTQQTDGERFERGTEVVLVRPSCDRLVGSVDLRNGEDLLEVSIDRTL